MIRKRIHFIQSLARGLAVLQTFTAERPEMTLTEVAQATGMNMAAAQRFTDTLVQLDFLRRNQDKRFYLGPQVLSLGFSFLNGSRLRRQADKYIEDFCRRHNKTTNLAIRDGGEIIFINRHESQLFLGHDLHPGSRLPANCTAQGKVLLAAMEDDELSQLLNSMDLKKFTPHTIVDPGLLWDDLMRIRDRGYSVANRELTMDLVSLGAPVLDGDHTVAAAVNVSLRWEDAEGDGFQQMLNALMELGAELSAALGHTGEYPFIHQSIQAGEPN